MVRLVITAMVLLAACANPFEEKATPTTVRVQYVNYTGGAVVFDVFADNDSLADQHYMGVRTIADAADTPVQVTGTLPMTVAVLATRDAFDDTELFRITKDQSGCTIPSILPGASSQSALKNAVAGKIIRVEARADGTLECREENPG